MAKKVNFNKSISDKLKKKKSKPKSKPPVKSTAIAKIPEKRNVPVLQLENRLDIVEFGVVLKKYCDENSLTVKIEDKIYPLVDAWKFTGSQFGLTAITDEPIAEHGEGKYVITLYHMQEFTNKRTQQKYTKEVPVLSGFMEDESTIASIRKNYLITKEVIKPYFAYKTNCRILKLSDGSVVGTGTGFCSNLEAGKVHFDQYAVNAMSQTRAISRGYRNLLGYVMNAAKIETTPAEEMDEVGKWKDAEVVKEKSSEKKTVTNVGFDNLCKGIKDGKYTLEKIMSMNTLTEDQIETLRIFEEQFKAKK